MIIMKKKVLVIDGHEVALEARADNLRHLGYDVTTSTGDAVPGKFDSVLYVIGIRADGREGERIRKIRENYPKAKLVVYSTQTIFQMYGPQIELARAETLPMIRTPKEIAAVL